MATTDADSTVLRIVNPDATPEEIAAIVAVLASLGGDQPAPTRPRSEWANPARGLRGSLAHGSGAWRTSGLPR
jgi:Ser/Thr protein kinase RdoA (MazF antagonist)